MIINRDANLNLAVDRCVVGDSAAPRSRASQFSVFPSTKTSTMPSLTTSSSGSRNFGSATRWTR